LTHLAPEADTVIAAHLVEAQARQCCKAVRVAGCEAAQEISRLQVEDVPDPETLSRQLEGTYDPSPETEPPV